MRHTFVSVVVVIIFATTVVRADEAADEKVCGEHLQRLAQAAQAYEKSTGKKPTKISDLYYGGFVNNPAELTCPASKTKIDVRDELDETSDYTLDPLADAKNEFVVREKTARHGKELLAAGADGKIVHLPALEGTSTEQTARGGAGPGGVTKSTPLPGESTTTTTTDDSKADDQTAGADDAHATDDKPPGPTTMITIRREGAEGVLQGEEADAALKGFMEKIAKQTDDAAKQEKAANEAEANADDAGMEVTKIPEEGKITVLQPGDVEKLANQEDHAALAEENEMPAQDADGVYVGEGAEFAHAGRALTGQKIRIEAIVTKMSAAAEPNGATWVDSEDGKFHVRVQWRECPADLEKFFRTIKRREGQKLSLTGKVRSVTPEQAVLVVEEWSAGD